MFPYHIFMISYTTPAHLRPKRPPVLCVLRVVTCVFSTLCADHRLDLLSTFFLWLVSLLRSISNAVSVWFVRCLISPSVVTSS